jgi:hypothetical protein
MTPGRKDRAYREAMAACCAVVALMAAGYLDAEQAGAAFDGVFYLLAAYTGGNAAEWFARRPTGAAPPPASTA